MSRCSTSTRRRRCCSPPSSRARFPRARWWVFYLQHPDVLLWADRLARRYGGRPSTYLLDPDREAVALDSAAATLGREADVQEANEAIRLGRGHVQYVVVVGGVH